MTKIPPVPRELLAEILADPLQRELSPQDVELFSEIGSNKLIYTAPHRRDRVLVIAQPRSSDYPLGREYDLLQELHDSAPQFFPTPEFYVEASECRVFGMEWCRHLRRIGERGNFLSPEMREALAYELGFAMGYVFQTTGLFTTAPTDDNILFSIGGDGIEIKLIDVAHFVRDDLERLTASLQRDQDLYREHQDDFNSGFEHGQDAGY